MTNRDRPSDAEIEDALETLLADCDEALARGEDPTTLLERLKDFPADAQNQFNEAYESLRSIKDMMPARSPALHFPRPFGKFRLLQMLGQGGFGLVFLAEDPALGRMVALKVPRLHQLVAPESSQRFAREARAAAALEHPHLVPVFEIGQAEGLTYLASAYCEGPTLSQWLKAQTSPVPIRAAAELVETLARAAAHMHGQGVVHRDLKPSNVLLFPNKSPALPGASARMEINGVGVKHACEDASYLGKPLDAFTPKITDFGLARQDDRVVELTRSGTMVGTAAYMSPEQAWGSSKGVGPASDIYALGTVLYELLTGRPPFQGENDLETLRQAKDEEPVGPRRLRLQMSRDLETICLKCLEKRPGRRYPSMTALADDLQRFSQGRAITARPAGWVDRTSKWVRRQPMVAALTGLAFVLIATLAIGSTWFGWREYQHRMDLEEALTNAHDQKILAEEREWQVRNQLYATQIRDSGMLKNTNRYVGMKEMLLAQKPAPGQKDVRGFEWHYLWQYGRDFMLGGSSVGRLAYSSDGKTCAAGCADQTIKVFDTTSGELLSTLQGHNSGIRSIDFTKDDTQLISTGFKQKSGGSGFQGECIHWDWRGRRVLWSKSFSHTSKNGSGCMAVASAARILFFIDRENSNRLEMINIDKGEEKILWAEKNVAYVATTPKADQIAVLMDQRLELWDIVSNHLVGSLEIPRPPLFAFAPNGKSLAVFGLGTDPLSIQIRDVPSLTKRATLSLPAPPGSLIFDWQGNRLAVNTSSSQLRWFNCKTGNLLGKVDFPGFSGGFAFSPNGEETAVGAMDGGVRIGKRIFNPAAELTLTGPLPQSEAWCLAFSKDGRTLAVGYDHEKEHPETLKLWDLKTQKAKALPGHKATVMALDVSRDGTTLATASYDRSVRFWDMATGKLQSEMNEHTHPVRALAVSPDGRQVASAGASMGRPAPGNEPFIKIWSTKDKVLTKSWHAHDDMIRALAFSPDGAFLISAANDRSIKVWSAKDYSLVHTIGDNSKVQGLASSPRGDLLASAHENNVVNIWDIAKFTHVKALLGHTGKVRCVAFSPDGKTLASGGEDKTVRLWHVLTGQELLVLPVDHFVNNLAFDRDGKTLAAALHNGKVKIWKAD